MAHDEDWAAGLYLRDTFVLREAVCRGIPVTTVIGGGYDEIMRLSARHTIIHRVAQQIFIETYGRGESQLYFSCTPTPTSGHGANHHTN
ncbi:hypothetical protein E2C01_007985 [Portunus trituberculatus]|uniref:Uncharacterized protein n=1 Tax=Portunus trituberculatus TaxID=210409 RepID=A0A5B7D0F1_PORTR|nr:hypothetical protein [Portunus trituberculatus]